ncbi:hypothetical protein LRS13_05530 [Svornostia abyssi]|uniref:Loricrin n=1 Tax=Svornostia abyssi TaxID=2898438 RepID=A0ABY5PK42_9ACTN|nr:hypothetical protein LRS13_05530 [Parviterribacteraceae bacterium J379]
MVMVLLIIGVAAIIVVGVSVERRSRRSRPSDGWAGAGYVGGPGGCSTESRDDGSSSGGDSGGGDSGGGGGCGGGGCGGGS